jgi:hypothetical protein
MPQQLRNNLFFQGQRSDRFLGQQMPERRRFGIKTENGSAE